MLRPQVWLVGGRGVRDGDRTFMTHELQVRPGREGERQRLAQPGPEERLPQAPAEGVRRVELADPADARERRPQVLVPLHPSDLLDQVLLPLQVGAEARGFGDDGPVLLLADDAESARAPPRRRMPRSRARSRATREPAERRRAAGAAPLRHRSPPRARRPPPHSVISLAARSAAGPVPSGSVPRENRSRPRSAAADRLEVRRIPRGSNYALSSRTSRRGRRHLGGGRPITPAIADGLLAVGDQQVVLDQLALHVVERRRAARPPRARRTTMLGPAKQLEVERVHRLAELEHHVVRGVDDGRQRSHARGGEPGLHGERRRGVVDPADQPREVARTAFGIPDLHRRHGLGHLLSFDRRRCPET